MRGLIYSPAILFLSPRSLFPISIHELIYFEKESRKKVLSQKLGRNAVLKDVKGDRRGGIAHVFEIDLIPENRAIVEARGLGEESLIVRLGEMAARGEEIGLLTLVEPITESV